MDADLDQQREREMYSATLRDAIDRRDFETAQWMAIVATDLNSKDRHHELLHLIDLLVDAAIDVDQRLVDVTGIVRDLKDEVESIKGNGVDAAKMNSLEEKIAHLEADVASGSKGSMLKSFKESLGTAGGISVVGGLAGLIEMIVNGQMS